NGVAPSLIDTRIFMKAIEDTGIRSIMHPLHRQLTNLTEETLIQNMTKAILDELDRMQPEITNVPQTQPYIPIS
ncbi:MAG: hypothetical protein PHO54_06035, partial [Candidatus Peribacteraceae bacterium]|nr:hypothetical protein [Candidatus Peribacteraceae bacterium]